MPIFDYECQKCGHAFEQVVYKVNDRIACPKCHSICIYKMISKTNFVLKGSGWAKDGYEKKTSDENND